MTPDPTREPRTDPIFRWLDSTDRRRPHDPRRPHDVTLRLAQITDIHIPGEIDLFERLRDFVSPHDSIGEVTHKISAISNEFGHQYRSMRRLYTNILKKTLVGLRRLGVDHLVITGDLAHCGLAPEFLEMRAILEVTGWWGEDRLTVVPGNHDRFNLYERLPREPMERFFDVVRSRQPRLKILPGGVALVEIDSNRDRDDDRHFSEQWLPNCVGRIYDEEIDWVAAQRAQVAGMRTIVCVHHHVSADWYPMAAESLGGLMNPAEGADHLLEAASLLDHHAVVLHGHKHDRMPVDYTLGAHPVACPGGFAESLSVNLIDLDAHGDVVRTQLQVR